MIIIFIYCAPSPQKKQAGWQIMYQKIKTLVILNYKLQIAAVLKGDEIVKFQFKREK